jgi:hypothetical protein
MNSYAYDQLRGSVKAGQLVFFKATKWNQKLITLITGGKYSHCGMAVWLTDGVSSRLMLIEATNGGRRIISLSHYADRSFEVIDVKLNYPDIAEEVLEHTGLPYSYIDFIKIGIRDIMLRFGIKTHLPNSVGEVCSEFLSNTVQKAGIKVSDALISPSALYKEMKALGTVIAAYKP